MKQLLILLFRPLDLPNPRIQPFGPSGFALLGGFARKKRRDTSPLVQAILGHRSFEDFVFDVRPTKALSVLGYKRHSS